MSSNLRLYSAFFEDFFKIASAIEKPFEAPKALLRAFLSSKLQNELVREPCFGILPGWYGMATVTKAGNGKKRKLKWKSAPSWTGAKMAKKWPKNGFLRELSIIFPFWGHFVAIFAPVQLVANFHFNFLFFPFPAFVTVCHAIPAWQDPKPCSRKASFWVVEIVSFYPLVRFMLHWA